jgi:hypothetical protein
MGGVELIAMANAIPAGTIEPANGLFLWLSLMGALVISTIAIGVAALRAGAFRVAADDIRKTRRVARGKKVAVQAAAYGTGR